MTSNSPFRAQAAASRRMAIFVLLFLVPVATQAEFTCTTNGGSLTITRYTGAGGTLSIPSDIDGLPVVAIESNAFMFKDGLTGITIPDSVTRIGNEAFFGCPDLGAVVIGDGVIMIGDDAFNNCAVLTNVTLGGSVKSIGDGAFHYTRLTRISIPAGVTNVGFAPFYWCPLEEITVDASNTTYSSRDGVLYDKDQTFLIKCPHRTQEGFEIPNTVLVIGESAFEMSDLTSIVVPDGVKSIGGGAFEYCGLTDVVVGNGVTNIGPWAFFGCFGLTGVTIGDSVISIGSVAFASCWNLTNITIPTRVTEIGSSAFSKCWGLEGMYFRGLPPALEDDAFTETPLAIIYYLPGSTGWGPTYGNRPTAPWNPQVVYDGTGGIRTNGFGFTIGGTSNMLVIVERCTNLQEPDWSILQTNTLANGTGDFTEPRWTNTAARFYRFRFP